jgi:hypothetical protein
MDPRNVINMYVCNAVSHLSKVINLTVCLSMGRGTGVFVNATIRVHGALDN